VEDFAFIILFPFNFHWYVTLPALTGVAVKVTGVAAQIVLFASEEVILTLGLKVTVLMGKIFELAFAVDLQLALEIISTLI
jgi:hypothetical protein